MPSPIPHEWSDTPPESLVAGDGCYTRALAVGLGTVSLPLDCLQIGPAPNDSGAYPRVLENLKRAVLVIPDCMSAAQALHCHAAVWDWVGKLTSDGDQHEIAFLFILPVDASKEYEQALAIGLGVSEVDPLITGHAICRRSVSLSEMLHLMAKVRPMDLLPLRARRAADTKRITLARLRLAVAQDNRSIADSAVREVLNAFSGHTYHLDLFCRPPSHQHGNRLRHWLNAVVTGPVTHDWWTEGREHLADWLISDEKSQTL